MEGEWADGFSFKFTQRILWNGKFDNWTNFVTTLGEFCQQLRYFWVKQIDCNSSRFLCQYSKHLPHDIFHSNFVLLPSNIGSITQNVTDKYFDCFVHQKITTGVVFNCIEWSLFLKDLRLLLCEHVSKMVKKLMRNYLTVCMRSHMWW